VSGFIEPTPDQAQAFAALPDDGPVVMVNLLRFKARADGIDAADGISGVEAYARYGAAVQRFLGRVDGEVVQALGAEAVMIGPSEPEWDMVFTVRYPSKAAFLTMVSDPEYQQIHGHRAAALADSRLIACRSLPVGELSG
jgi:uncharacterized protein (DUF1330 family)